jgi:hypothetical protein
MSCMLEYLASFTVAISGLLFYVVTFWTSKALNYFNGLSGSGYALSLLHMLYNVKCK